MLLKQYCHIERYEVPLWATFFEFLDASMAYRNKDNRQALAYIAVFLKHERDIWLETYDGFKEIIDTAAK